MNDDYLWDRTGVEDPEVARLERALRHFRREPSTPGEAPAPARRVGTRLLALAAAASALAALAWVLRESRPAPGYGVEALAGSPHIEGRRDDGGLRAGDTLSTDERSRARLEVAQLGSLVLEPGTRLRIERPERGAPGAEHLFFLERGTVVASIFAAPRAFQVGTPAGIAVDLGCIYTTTVEPDGSTRLGVLSGQVSFEAHERRAIVPSGAWCRAAPGAGPGPAFREEAAPVWVAAVEALARDAEPSDSALAAVLEGARGEDGAVTLWHLLEHPSARVRERVLDALAAVSPPPADLERARLVSRDRDALDRWRRSMSWSW